MAKLSARFRSSHPLTPGRFRTGHYLAPICPDGKPAHKALVWYPTKGCSWAVKSGCTMCNFGQWSSLPDSGRLMDGFIAELDKLDPGTRYMHIGPGGSVLRDREVSPDLRKRLIGQLKKFVFLKSLGIESRAETMNSEQILEIESTLGENVTELSIDFGLESSSDLIRRVAVNKHQTREMLGNAFNAVKIANSKSSRSIVVDCYVLLKPIFLSENEAIEDCVRSINWAYDQGASTVTIFMSTVKIDTIMKFLCNVEMDYPFKYATPYYHSVWEVLKRLHPLRRRRTGVLGLTSGRPFDVGPRSCEFCKFVHEGLIATHNYTRDASILSAASEINCPCKSSWKEEIQTKVQGTLAYRFREYIDLLDAEFARNDW